MSKSKSNSETVPWDETETSSAAVTEEPIGFSEFDSFGSSDGADEPEDAPIPPEKEPLIDEIASEYVGFWNLLVSKTNWEKGKVIHSWRTKLIEAGLPRRVYSDEAISQRLGNVTPQHVGRLRRVYERFGSQEPLPNLFWSHYQAALDWDDADEWLQKASVEKLSVAQTRVARWEKNGAKLNHKPREEDIVDAEKDEDVNPYNDSEYDGSDAAITPGRADVSGDDAEKKSKKKKESKNRQGSELGEFAGASEPWEGTEERFTTADVLDSIAKLDALPDDLAEAFEQVKVGILSHKLAGWDDVRPITIASYLSEFKRLLVSEEK